MSRPWKMPASKQEWCRTSCRGATESWALEIRRRRRCLDPATWPKLVSSNKESWSGARDLNPRPHGPEPGQGRVLSCPVVSARFLLYSNWIFFVSSCDLLYPPGSVNALHGCDLQGFGD